MNRYRLGWLVFVLAIVPLLAGCGGTSEAAPARPTATVTVSPPTFVGSHPSPTAAPSEPPVSPTSASAPPQNPLPPSDAQIEAVLAAYPAPWATKQLQPVFVPADTQEFSDGQGGSLTVVIGTWRWSADGSQNLVFVWHDQRFLGVTTTQWSFDPTLTAIPNGFVVTYYQWGEALPFAQWQPSTAINQLPVRYTWSGAQLVPSYTGPIPSPMSNGIS